MTASSPRLIDAAIALTADAMPVNMHNMEWLGFDRILTKPFKVLELLDFVRMTLKAA